ncbi:MAG: TIGR03560 family F420-dependent LLM class oxidoreductase [Candidatus Dadabacteria bacterium]|nr:MAG: TIGR03560 family F420-dependent LLM class oxidoreductase [Candidatus Dadabacteria bacterium]
MERASAYVFLPQIGQSYPVLRERARLIERLGFDGLWLVDHFWAQGYPEADFLEAWTAVAALAEATSRLRLGVLVTCNSYRHPAVLAKIAATADHVAGGRIELGIGAGWMEEEYRAYGIPFPPVAQRLEQLGEALAVIRSLFRNRRTTFDGRHYRLRNAPFQPKPVQECLPITIGGSGTRIMMRLVARYADRWNCPMPAAPRLCEHLAALRRYCAEIGRPPEAIVISEQVAVVVGADEGDVREKRAEAERTIGGFVDLDTMAVTGTPAAVVEVLRERMALGVRDFAVLFGDLAGPDSLELFARTVLPKLTVAT